MVCSLLIIGLSLCLSGCVPEESHSELMKLVAQYDMNTIPTVVHYIGSDDTHDYFYIDVPFGRNRTCKVNRVDTMVQKRYSITRDKSRWNIYHPVQAVGLTNMVMIKFGTNIVLTTDTKLNQKNGAEPSAGGDGIPPPQP